MKNTNFFLILALIMTLFTVQSTSACSVCSNCTNCGPDILSDNYLDEIDALMQGKVQNLGYPLTITRNQTSASITYEIQYSSGLLIVLQLSLGNMQIQLLNYSINSNINQATTSSSSASVTTYKTTTDGYYIISNFTNVKEVNEIMTYLTSVIKNNMTNFQLIGVEFTNSSATLYRLKFQVLPISSNLNSIVENVLVQYISSNNCLLIDSNYSSLSSNLTYLSIDTKTAINDVYISSINALLIKKYNNLLGNAPTIVSLDEALPYYKLVYQVSNSNYSFIILYDYFQNRILQGNLTIYKLMTYTQAQVSTGDINATVAAFVGASTASQAATTSTSSSSASASTTSNTNAQSSSSTTSTTSAQNTIVSQGSGSSSSSASVEVPSVNIVIPSPPITSSSVTSNSASTSAASSSTSSVASLSTSSAASSSASTSSSSSSSTAGSTQNQATFLEIAHFQANPQVISTISFLVSLGQNVSMGQIQSAQKYVNGSTINYRIIILVNSLGQVSINKSLFYQFIIQLSSSGIYSVLNTSYTSLNPPSFAILSLDEVKSDGNIKLIARYLLSQQFAMLSTDSKVLAVYRDIPYYQIVFQGPGSTQINFIILYNFNGTIAVMSATQRQVPSPPSYVQSQNQAQAQVQSQVKQPQSQPQQSQVQASSITQTSQVGQSAQTTTTSQNTQQQITQASQSIPPQQNSGFLTVQPILQQTTVSSNQAPINQNQQVIAPTQQTTTQTTTSTISQQTQPIITQTKNLQSSDSSSTQTVQVDNAQFTPVKLVPVSAPATNPSQTQVPVITNAVNTSNSSSISQVQTNIVSSTVTVQKQAISQTNNTQIPTVSKPIVANSTQNSIASSPVQVNPTLNGFNHFGGPSDQLYSYALQGITQINQTLTSKGYSINDLIYRDIVYKLEGTVLTILFKVEATGLMFTYQFKGSLGSSYVLTNTGTPTVTQTSSDTQNYGVNATTIVSAGVTYQIAPSSLNSQAYIQKYLSFLESSDLCYSRSNLVGIFLNTVAPNSLLFRFKNVTQFYNIVTNTVEIQRILAIYLSESNGQSTPQQSQGQSQAQATSSSVQTSSVSTSPVITSGTTSSLQGSSTTTSSPQLTSAASSTQTSTPPTPTAIATSIQASTASTTSSTAATSTQTSTASVSSSSQSSSSASSAQISTASSSASAPNSSSQVASASSQATSVPAQQPNVTKPQITVNTQSNYNSSDQIVTITHVDSHCLCYDLNKCIKCAHRFYLNNNQCIQVPNECLSYDINTGVCVKCLPGYSLLQNGLCHLDDVTAYYYENQCFQCLGDYRLVNKKCVYAPVTNPSSPSYLQTKNPLCLSWNNGKCNECLPGTYFSSRSLCQLIDPFCLIFDFTQQVCSTCNTGFTLRNGKCFQSQ